MQSSSSALALFLSVSLSLSRSLLGGHQKVKVGLRKKDEQLGLRNHGGTSRLRLEILQQGYERLHHHLWNYNVFINVYRRKMKVDGSYIEL